jgi:hypothetical protein
MDNKIHAKLKREENINKKETKVCYFYAPLTKDLTPEKAHDSDFTVYKSTIGSVSSDGVYLSAAAHGVMWNCSVPVNTSLTFGCWVKRTGGSGINYSFGAGTKNNARYYGAQLSQYSNTWLITEYLYLCTVNGNYMPVTNTWTYINWTIVYNGNNNYTFKFYKNGVLVETRNVTNAQWLGMANCYFAISHFTNSMFGYYKHFSCYEELTDAEVAQLYQNGGVAV